MKLILENVKKAYDGKEVLKDASFQFEKGKIYGLLGRNGAGKTTLFNILAEETDKDHGEIFLEEEGAARSLETEDLSYVYATPVLPEFLTGYEFIKFFMDISKDKIKGEKTPDAYFDMMRIDHTDRHKLIKSYSQGMKNKLQMLLFLISEPPVILLDEPLTSLDVVVALEIKKLLRQIKENHVIIFSTHILQLAVDLCDEIVILSDGVLSLLDHTMLKDPGFEEEIIRRLSEEKDV